MSGIKFSQCPFRCGFECSQEAARCQIDLNARWKNLDKVHLEDLNIVHPTKVRLKR